VRTAQDRQVVVSQARGQRSRVVCETDGMEQRMHAARGRPAAEREPGGAHARTHRPCSSRPAKVATKLPPTHQAQGVACIWVQRLSLFCTRRATSDMSSASSGTADPGECGAYWCGMEVRGRGVRHGCRDRGAGARTQSIRSSCSTTQTGVSRVMAHEFERKI
jgi:hypothetical protein